MCRLSYATSVLQTFGDFDLNAVMLQEGHIRQLTKDKRHFREDTVVAIPSTIRAAEVRSNYHNRNHVFSLLLTSNDSDVLYTVTYCTMENDFIHSPRLMQYCTCALLFQEGSVFIGVKIYGLPKFVQGEQVVQFKKSF